MPDVEEGLLESLAALSRLLSSMLYGVASTILRFGIPYGPRARPAAVIPAFIAKARAAVGAPI